MSDLHIDLNQFSDFELDTLIRTLKEEAIDWLHIAGDISNHHKEISLPFLEQLKKHIKVTYNLGNHDMLDLTEAEIEEKDFQLHDLGSHYLLAFHGWYDYSFYPQKSVQENLAHKKRFWFDRRLDRPQNDPNLTQTILKRLDKLLAQLDKPSIVAMHFVPHQDFTMTHPKFAPFNAFLGSQTFHEVFRKYAVADVVFGHAHRSYGQVERDGIRYHSRPLGYIREWDLTIDYVNEHPHLNSSGTWNLSKRYNLVKNLPDYQAYKKAQLATEFRDSMTIFEI